MLYLLYLNAMNVNLNEHKDNKYMHNIFESNF